jgi:hypothetical protein
MPSDEEIQQDIEQKKLVLRMLYQSFLNQLRSLVLIEEPNENES